MPPSLPLLGEGGFVFFFCRFTESTFRTMHNPKLLGIPIQFLTTPLTQALRANSSFQLIEESRATIATQLREQELSAALLSPLEYAKESSEYRIVPGIAAVSEQGSIVIRFRDGVKSFGTLAVDPNFASEIILAKIILAEQFDIEPKILPMIASVDVMLQKAEAALLVGDAAFREARTASIIDIVEEWNDLTGLPLVHALWCTRDGDLTTDDVQAIQNAAAKGVAGMSDIVMAFPKDERESLQQYLESFSYVLSGEANDSLAEFMKYLYYHGILPDVAELNFYKTEDEEKDDLLSDISPN